MGKNIDISKILNFIMEYELTQEQVQKLENSNNKESLVYDMILAEIKQKFGVDMSENFEICLNVTEFAELLVMQGGMI